jgi:hypothetical protein
VRRPLVGLIAITLLVVAACLPPRPSPSPPPESPTPAATPSATATPPTSTGSADPSGATSSTGIVVDPSLLELLPDAVAGIPLQPDEATANEIAGEASIAPFVSGLAIAAAFGPTATDTVDDYVVVTVARLKPGLFGDLFYRGWRDTFDSAVCEQAGGVEGHAQAVIGGRQTYIGSCAGGVHTYHVHLPDQNVIVSMQGAGDGRFGERVVEGLNE